MGDPVWLGNYIVPRWEAFLILGAVPILFALVVIVGLWATTLAARVIWKLVRF